jgi:hypothetical protein
MANPEVRKFKLALSACAIAPAAPIATYCSCHGQSPSLPAIAAEHEQPLRVTVRPGDKRAKP